MDANHQPLLAVTLHSQLVGLKRIIAGLVKMDFGFGSAGILPAMFEIYLEAKCRRDAGATKAESSTHGAIQQTGHVWKMVDSRRFASRRRISALRCAASLDEISHFRMRRFHVRHNSVLAKPLAGRGADRGDDHPRKRVTHGVFLVSFPPRFAGGGPPASPS